MRLPALLTAATALIAAAPAPQRQATVWHAKDLQNRHRTLKANGNIALESLGKFGNHRANMIQRERSGEAEIHEHVADLLVVQAGEATLITGGRVPGAKTTTAGELRGPQIEGGSKQTIGPGDIIQVPPGVPHQIVLAPGGKITYFALKIDSPR